MYTVCTPPQTASILLYTIIIIIMEICKAPTLRLKALNKHTHIMYIEMENVIKEKKKITTRVFKHYARDAHTHTVQTDRSERQCGLTEIF